MTDDVQPIVGPPCDQCGGETEYYDCTSIAAWFKCEPCSTEERYVIVTRPR